MIRDCQNRLVAVAAARDPGGRGGHPVPAPAVRAPDYLTGRAHAAFSYVMVSSPPAKRPGDTPPHVVCHCFSSVLSGCAAPGAPLRVAPLAVCRWGLVPRCGRRRRGRFRQWLASLAGTWHGGEESDCRRPRSWTYIMVTATAVAGIHAKAQGLQGAALAWATAMAYSDEGRARGVQR
jgi:hypothetical protein